MTEPAPKPTETWTVNWEPQIGYQIETGNPDSAVKINLPPQAIIPATAPDPVVPTARQWWCVVSEEGLGAIHGPYLTEAAAQSLVDEGTPGHVVQMQLS